MLRSLLFDVDFQVSVLMHGFIYIHHAWVHANTSDQKAVEIYSIKFNSIFLARIQADQKSFRKRR